MNVWLVNQERILTSVEMEVNKCIKQQLDLNLVSRYKTTKNIQNVKKLLEQASLIVLDVVVSQSL